MKANMRNITEKGKLLMRGWAASALMLVCVSVLELTITQACLWYTCQPKAPADLEKLDLKEL